MNYYNEIRKQLINNEITKKVKDYSKNKSDLETYYNVGKLIIEAQGGEFRAKYGDGLIKEYSRKLTIEFGNGYSERSLKRMRKFYLYIKKGTPLATQLMWSHYIELLPIKDINEINYYIDISIKQNLSRNELRNRIKNNEYERLDENTKNKLILKEKNIITDFVKNPLIIKNMNNLEVVNEKILQKLILENIPLFLRELGDGFSFISNEYKIKIGNSYNYIDLLLFNYIYNCFVVIELKVTELKKEHIGQIEVYMNYIDRNIKSINQDNTIGIIICRKDNKFIMSYSSDKRVLSREFLLI